MPANGRLEISVDSEELRAAVEKAVERSLSPLLRAFGGLLMAMAHDPISGRYSDEVMRAADEIQKALTPFGLTDAGRPPLESQTDEDMKPEGVRRDFVDRNTDRLVFLVPSHCICEWRVRMGLVPVRVDYPYCQADHGV